MENKEFYTPMEKILIEGLKTHERMVEALALDIMILKMEEKLDMMDGFKGEEIL